MSRDEHRNVDFYLILICHKIRFSFDFFLKKTKYENEPSF